MAPVPRGPALPARPRAAPHRAGGSGAAPPRPLPATPGASEPLRGQQAAGRALLAAPDPPALPVPPQRRRGPHSPEGQPRPPGPHRARGGGAEELRRRSGAFPPPPAPPATVAGPRVGAGAAGTWRGRYRRHRRRTQTIWRRHKARPPPQGPERGAPETETARAPPRTAGACAGKGGARRGGLWEL